MSTDKYTLRDMIYSYCSVNIILLEAFLDKLSHDDLEMLEMIVKDAYNTGKQESDGGEY